MIRKLPTLLLLFFCLKHNTYGQNIVQTRPYQKDYFRYPLDLPPSTAGSFGELRANHFHSGLDFKTNEITGYPVHAAADGFVSRLRVEFGGYGNAIYISHPNGYTTVYGHLKSFSPELEQIVHDYQLQQKNDIVDFNLLPMQVPVTKGQVIALSGNTGDAVGPHLHFEIRDTQTQETINPQLFGLTIPDHVPPTLGTICIYHLGDAPFSEKTGREFLAVTGANGKYRLTRPHIIKVSGNTGFGITATDMNSTSHNHNGIYSIELKLDGKTVFTFAIERFAFDQTHAINAYIDYPEFVREHRFMQKCFILPGNKMPLYPQSVNRGIINFNDDSLHEVEYVVKDIAGNTSTLTLKVQSGGNGTNQLAYKPQGTLFRYDQLNEFNTDRVKVIVPPGNLYDDMDFIFSVLPQKPGAFSPTYEIGDKYTPINDSCSVWIKPDTMAPGWRADKAVIVNTDGICEGGIYQDGYVKAQTRTFGDYFVKLDTVPPFIIPLDIKNGSNMAKKRTISLRIGDSLSGIKNYYGYIDGKWVLMLWDYKTKILSYTFDDTVLPGNHTFELTVTDQKDNSDTFKADFYR